MKLRYALSAALALAVVAMCSDTASACDGWCDPWPGIGAQCISIGYPHGSVCEQVGDVCWYVVSSCRAATPKIDLFDSKPSPDTRDLTRFAAIPEPDAGACTRSNPFLVRAALVPEE